MSGKGTWGTAEEILSKVSFTGFGNISYGGFIKKWLVIAGFCLEQHSTQMDECCKKGRKSQVQKNRRNSRQGKGVLLGVENMSGKKILHESQQKNKLLNLPQKKIVSYSYCSYKWCTTHLWFMYTSQTFCWWGRLSFWRRSRFLHLINDHHRHLFWWRRRDKGQQSLRLPLFLFYPFSTKSTVGHT